MSREIKFRGKRVDNGQWAYGYVVFSQDKLTAWISESKEDDWTVKGQVEVIPESVGQFTGLKDKNGKEIYERDIVRHNGRCESVIEFEAEDVGFKLKNKQLGKMHPSKEFFKDHVEVIGNIYDNPSLLEVQP